MIDKTALTGAVLLEPGSIQLKWWIHRDLNPDRLMSKQTWLTIYHHGPERPGMITYKQKSPALKKSNGEICRHQDMDYSTSDKNSLSIILHLVNKIIHIAFLC